MTTSPVSAAPVATPAPGPPALARVPVLTVAAVVGLAHLAVASLGGRWFDEALMVAIGRHHLDWGSVDQPPVAPLLAALADRVAPGSSLALATPAVLATAAAVVLAALVARELGGDVRAQTLTALAQGTGAGAAALGHWLTPYALEPVQWLAIAWLLVRWVRTRDDRLLLALGVVVGVAAQTKFQVLLLAAVLLVAVAVLGPRALLRRPRLWIGAGTAALIAAPTLVWQAVNGWPQLAMGPIVASEADFLYGGRTGVAIGMLLVAGVLGLGLGGLGLVRLLRAPEHRELRFLAATTLVLFVLFAVTPGRPYYLAGLYGLLAAAGAVGLQRRREAGRSRWRWIAWPATAASVAVAAGMLLPVSTALATPVVADAVAATTARAHQALPPAQRARTALVGGSYVYAAYLDAAPPRLALPPAYSPNRSYGWFDPPPAGLDAALFVGDPAVLRPFFDDVRAVAVVDPGGAPGIAGEDTRTRVWLLTGQRAPWTAIWASTRSLDVS